MNHMRLFRNLIKILFFFLIFGIKGWAMNFPTISTEELKARIDTGEEMFLLNPLSDIEFNEGHIPGSVNIPLHEIAETDKLPTAKDAFIVTYCLGPK